MIESSKSGHLSGTMVGEYRLGDVLGRGGMGVVYEATHAPSGTTVAIKIITEGAYDDAGLRNRFLAEANALARIGHHGIVSVYGVERLADGRPAIVMERLRGESFDGVLARRGSLQPGLAVEWFRQILAALDAAHAVGVIHRDLKPGNMFVTESGRMVLLDFGVAKFLDTRASGDIDMRNLSCHQHVLGTVPYMSPEQAAGEPLDARSDVFSVAVALYEALCGRRPFRGRSLFRLCNEHARGAPDLAGVSVELAAVVRRALSAGAEDRWESMHHMSAALFEAGTDAPDSGSTVPVLSAIGDVPPMTQVHGTHGTPDLHPCAPTTVGLRKNGAAA